MGLSYLFVDTDTGKLYVKGEAGELTELKQIIQDGLEKRGVEPFELPDLRDRADSASSMLDNAAEIEVRTPVYDDEHWCEYDEELWCNHREASRTAFKQMVRRWSPYIVGILGGLAALVAVHARTGAWI